MRKLIASISMVAVILLAASVAMPAQAPARGSDRAAPAPSLTQREGLFQSLGNASLVRSGDGLVLTRQDQTAPMTITFAPSEALGITRDAGQWWVLPLSTTTTQITVNHALWVLPPDPSSKDRSWELELQDGSARATQSAAGLSVLLNTDHVAIHQAEARPHSDAFRNRFRFAIASGAELEDALAAFYWGTMLPSVVEKTMAARFLYSSGYVLSTLNTSSYAGSYPAVDHEFQIKGRLAVASPLDLDIVRRMIELQFRLMDDDPERLSRAPTSVQPDGRREYHIRRDSQNHHVNAAMFPYTANIEVIEEAWHYLNMTKDLPWLRASLPHLERAAAWTEAGIDQYHRLWSDVYYEDQVIKDGRVTQAQAFAAHSFDLLSRIEKLTGHPDRSARYARLSQDLARALIQPLPMGYWDPQHRRFIDWVDRDGQLHDHLHLLANTLPVTFGYATPDQTAAVMHLVEANAAEFERFPSFLSADIAAYTPSEIGDGGPYDLSAAGRYWFWDGAFRAATRQNARLSEQLLAVAREGAKSQYLMGERYDMDHVYYVDGKDAHGAGKYYEYPNVFAAVLINQYLGVTVPASADLSLAPHLTGFGSVELQTPVYAVRYSYAPTGFTVENLSGKPRRLLVDLSGLGPEPARYRSASRGGAAGSRFEVTLAPHGSAQWVCLPAAESSLSRVPSADVAH